MILLIDNYDSFSYNLYQLLGSKCDDIKVIRNDEMTCEEIEKLSPDLIVLSPGPKKPSDAGICIDAVKYFKGKIPVFGVCLGHQSICEAYGATVSYASKLMHGKTSTVEVKGESDLFSGLEPEFLAARYHSLSVVENTLPDELTVTAIADDGEIMAVEDRVNKVYGVQFHPESVLTPQGGVIIENLFKTAKILG